MAGVKRKREDDSTSTSTTLSQYRDQHFKVIIFQTNVKYVAQYVITPWFKPFVLYCHLKELEICDNTGNSKQIA